MELGKISVIIPVYNAEGTLERCIESILHQTYSNFEIILIDDGSTDSSGIICDSYQKRISQDKCRVIHQKNSGVSSARNKGISLSTGLYIVFIDSDDFVESDYLETFMIAKSKYRNIDSIWCGYVSVSKISSIEKKYVLNESEEYTLMDRKRYMDLSINLLSQMPWNKLYNTSIIKKYNIKMNEKIDLGEDLLFNMSYLDRCPNTSIIIINKACYNYYNDNTSSLNNKYRENLFYINLLIDRKMKYYLQKWQIDKNAWHLYYNEAFFRYDNTLTNIVSSHANLSFFKKMNRCNRILKSSEFKDSLRLSSCKMNTILRMCYQSCHYEFVVLFWQINHIKQRIQYLSNAIQRYLSHGR